MPIKLIFITPIIVFVLWAFIGGMNGEADYQRSEKAILTPDNNTYIELCRELIKDKLIHPDSFDEALFSIRTSRSKEGDVGVVMDFSSLDDAGMPAPKKASCAFGVNDKNEVWIFDVE